MHVGFILTKTPVEEGFRTFLKFINIYREDQVSIYLLGNGVYCGREGHSESKTIKEILTNSRIYTCLDDIKARGISDNHLINGVKTFESYDDMVIDIMENMDQVMCF
jgi:sulfur relay protein TusB/DsrH